MAERRALIEGLKTLDPNIDVDQAEDFISGEKRPRAERQLPHRPQAASQATEAIPALPPLPQSVVDAAQVPTPSPLTGVGRVPIGARVRTELAAGLKRAALQRQLNGIQPFAIQEILEEAIELWLLKNGHPLH
jgi:hypothetical protein